MSNRVRLIGWCTFLVMLSLIPLFITSGRWIDFLEMTMFVAVLGQGWNILGGYGGQYSFGNALFFGTGAYIQALLQFKAQMEENHGMKVILKPSLGLPQVI